MTETTLEDVLYEVDRGLAWITINRPQRYNAFRNRTIEELTAPALHPVQQAMLDEQAIQCGYCYNGMIVKASELLSKTPQPSDSQIRSAMNGHLCRCGTYPRILKAIERASLAMKG